MSIPRSPGLVDASHWTYVATAMAAALEDAARTSNVDQNTVPRGVLSAVLEFFKIVKEAVGQTVPRDPVASAANYAIAARALRATEAQSSLPRSILNERLVNFADAVAHLSEPRALGPEDTQLYLQVARFFKSIAQEGETKAYERYSSPPTA